MRELRFDYQQLQRFRQLENVPNTNIKLRERAEIERQTAEFLARGGEIHRCGSDANRCPVYRFNNGKDQESGGVKD